MRKSQRGLAWALAFVGAAWSLHAQAQPCDVDDYITKAIGIEEPWIENAAYLYGQVDNNGSPRAATLAPELEARLAERVGLELDLPAYTAQEPLGRGPSAFGPLAAGIKLAGLHLCDMAHGRATLLTGEVEAQYWGDRRPQVLPGEGNSVTAQALWAQLWYPWFTQGEAGYTQRVGPGVTSGWFINTSFGRALGTAYAIQLEVELDNQLQLDNGRRGMQGSLMPQIAWHVSPRWLLALGQQASFEQGASRPHWSTWLMLERELSP